MDLTLQQYKNNVTRLFEIGVRVLKGARSLKNISVDLKLLAINGIAKAAKFGSNQGQSLITLSGFLSDLPAQIAPELVDLERLAGRLSRQVTISAIAIRRYSMYLDANSKTIRFSNFLQKTLDEENKNQIGQVEDNLKIFRNKNSEIDETVKEFLRNTEHTIYQAKKKIEKIRRNGFIASYMGVSISIESAYLPRGMRSFDSLVRSIKDMVDTLDSNLDDILDQINSGGVLITNLLKTENLSKN